MGVGCEPSARDVFHCSAPYTAEQWNKAHKALSTGGLRCSIPGTVGNPSRPTPAAVPGSTSPGVEQRNKLGGVPVCQRWKDYLMNLKALAEQRLAALGAQPHGAVGWASRPVPSAPEDEPAMEQGRAAGVRPGSQVRLARFFGLSTAGHLACVLDDLASGQRLVEVNPGPSEHPILLASDDAAIDPGERRVVYRAAELHEALGLPVSVLRELHWMKRQFTCTLQAN